MILPVTNVCKGKGNLTYNVPVLQDEHHASTSHTIPAQCPLHIMTLPA